MIAGMSDSPSVAIGDGFGDSSVSDLLARYERWNYAVATGRVSQADPDFEDLVQEARIAMWQASQKADPEKGGAHAKWLTQAAEWRISEVQRRHTWTGHTKVRGKVDDPLLRKPASIEALAEAGDMNFEAVAAEPGLLDSILLSYHYGQIAEAVASLPPAQRAYVVQRFWKGKTDVEIAAETGRSDSAVRLEWNSKIKPLLQERLAGLETMAA